MINGEGFYVGPDWIWDADTDLTVYERAIITVLYRWAKRGGMVKRSKKRIGLDANIKDIKTINKALRSLQSRKVSIAGQEYKMLEIFPQKVNKRDYCTEYKLPPLHERVSPKFKHKSDKNHNDLGVEQIHPYHQRGGTDPPLRGVPHPPLRGAPHPPLGTTKDNKDNNNSVDVGIVTKMKHSGVDGIEAKRLFTKYGHDICKNNTDWFIKSQEAAKRLKQRIPKPGLLVTAIKDDYSELRWKTFIEDMEAKAEKEKLKHKKMIQKDKNDPIDCSCGSQDCKWTNAKCPSCDRSIMIKECVREFICKCGRDILLKAVI